MKISNYGKTSLLVSLMSWAVGVVFTLLSWWAVAITYEGHGPEDSKPESLLVDVLPIVALFAFPGAILATVFGVVALYKRHSRVKATLGILLSVSLLLLFVGLWIATRGGV